MRHVIIVLVLVACGSPAGVPSQDASASDARADAAPQLCKVVDANVALPVTISGTVNGAGPDVRLYPSACGELVDHLWFDPMGEDVVIAVRGLTVGETYAVVVDTHDDLSFYVVDRCPDAMPSVGCAVFADASYGTESASFVATESEHYVVIDTAADPLPITGTFTLTVKAAECTSDAMCTSPGATVCEHFACRECRDSFGCSSAAPLCNADNACVASPSQCWNDDARELNGGDDGPSRATSIAVPTATARTIARGDICSAPAGEEVDWYSFTVASTTSLGLELVFPLTPPQDLDFAVYATDGTLVEAAQSKAGKPERMWLPAMLPGTYYVSVDKYAPRDNIAVPYALTVNAQECFDAFDCTSAVAPVCDDLRACVAGPARCIGDDAGDAAGDDGPAGARSLTAPLGVTATLSGVICNSPSDERDFYKVTLADGDRFDATVTWDDSAFGSFMTVQVLDSSGESRGYGYMLQSSLLVAIENYPAGTYYLEVSGGKYSAGPIDYTISATRNP